MPTTGKCRERLMTFFSTEMNTKNNHSPNTVEDGVKKKENNKQIKRNNVQLKKSYTSLKNNHSNPIIISQNIYNLIFSTNYEKIGSKINYISSKMYIMQTKTSKTVIKYGSVLPIWLDT